MLGILMPRELHRVFNFNDFLNGLFLILVLNVVCVYLDALEIAFVALARIPTNFHVLCQ